MSWFKVDDRFWSHPKTATLSDGATALWIRAGSWSAGHLTDGFVPDSALRFFRARRRSAAELVSAGLWSAADGGFVFHDWDVYQPSKEQVSAKREASKNRVNAWRERNRNGVTDASQVENGNASPDPTRTRPDPTLSSGGGSATRGTRIPEQFMVTAEMRAWAAEKAPLVNLERSTERFVNYWRGLSGVKATKKDWPATWRNWLLKDQEDHESRGPRAGSPSDRAAATLALAEQPVPLRAVGS